MEVIIDRGIESFMNDVESEITELCGKRYKHIAERRFTRWGSTDSSLVLGGKKVKINHPRVRNVETNKEHEIEILEHFKSNDVLTKKQMEQMILGVSTRKYKRSLEASSKKFPGFGTSKSSVSRGFIAQTISKLNAWLSKPIKEDYPIIMLDGLEVKKRTILIAVGIKIGGKKDILGARDGSTENSRICIDLLQDLIERGLDPSKVKLVVIDGGTGLRKAVKDVFGKTFLIQRCQLHKKRNVMENLPPHKRDTILNAMNEAYKSSSYKTAKRLLNNLIIKLEKEEPRAAGSLKEELEETLTLLRMKCPKKLQKSLATTNPT
jgi:transposase-like protein